MENFSCLEKDDKTFYYVKEYYGRVCCNETLCICDIDIQRHELEDHLKNNNKDLHDNKEVALWIEKNSRNFRTYINSIKLLTFFIFSNNQINHIENLDKGTFCTYIDIWNNKKHSIIDSLYFK